ncbi:MAG: hypothetical protein KAT46_01805 [Deltaproteobacteria bacterium]|nr:hypothetical protein [Deltaproteobacteria bacterium]
MKKARTPVIKRGDLFKKLRKPIPAPTKTHETQKKVSKKKILEEAFKEFESEE